MHLFDKYVSRMYGKGRIASFINGASAYYSPSLELMLDFF
jgi:hypothetical protein